MSPISSATPGDTPMSVPTVCENFRCVFSTETTRSYSGDFLTLSMSAKCFPQFVLYEHKTSAFIYILQFYQASVGSDASLFCCLLCILSVAKAFEKTFVYF